MTARRHTYKFTVEISEAEDVLPVIEQLEAEAEKRNRTQYIVEAVREKMEREGHGD